jgi:hypothetical protein
MKIGPGFKVRLEYVLEQVVKNLSDGGDHKNSCVHSRAALGRCAIWYREI